MSVQRYLDILARRLWVILFTLLIALIVAAAGSYVQQPIYSASATVRVAQAPADGIVEYVEYMYAERLLKTYGEILKSGPFLDETITRLKLKEMPEDLVKRIKVEVILNTELIKITADAPDPGQAAGIANTLASLLVERSQSLFFGGTKSAREIIEEQLRSTEENLQRNRTALKIAMGASPPIQETIDALTVEIKLGEEIYAGLMTQYEQAQLSEASQANNVTVSEPATVPRQPSKPRIALNLALAALVGLLAGLALAFLLESLDSTLHNVGDLEAVTHLPVLGLLPLAGGLRTPDRAIAFSNPAVSPTLVEAYRMLRTSILASGAGFLPRRLLITSPEAGTGKSIVSANLAVAIAQTGRRVVIVDADLRRSSQHKIFGLPNVTGLSTVLRGETGLEAALQETSYPNLRVLTAGPQPPDPAELLGSQPGIEFLAGLEGVADLVLVDSPPLLAVTDSAALLPHVDGSLLVVARDLTTSRRIQAACQLAEKVGGKITGVIFNRAQGDERYYSYHYDYGGPAHARYHERRRRKQTALALAGGLLLLGAVGVALLWRPSWTEYWTAAAGLVIRPSLPQPAESVPASTSAGRSGQPSPGTPAPQSPALLSPTITAGMTAGSALPVVPTPTPSLPRMAYIASTERGLRDGVFLYEDPVTAVPSPAWLQSGATIEVLEVDVYGRVLYGSPRWYRIRCSLGGRTYMGFVPATLVTWTP